MGRMPMQHLLQEFQPRQRHQAMQAFAKSKRSLKQARKENTVGSLERLYANSNDQRQSRQGMLKLYNLIDDWIDWRRICSIWALLQPPTFFQQLYLRKERSILFWSQLKDFETPVVTGCTCQQKQAILSTTRYMIK